MTYSHISNSTRTILRKASLMVECMICDVLDVFRTCLMSVSETWWSLFPNAMLISQIELQFTGLYKDIEVTLFYLRNVVLFVIPIMLHVCTGTCYYPYEISNCVGSHYSNFHNLHELGIIPGDGAWYSKRNKQLVIHEQKQILEYSELEHQGFEFFGKMVGYQT